MRFSKTTVVIVGILAFCGVLLMAGLWYAIYGPNVPKDIDNTVLVIPTGSNYEDLQDILTENHQIKSARSFDLVATLMKYKSSSIRSGKFDIQPNWSNRQLISHLRSGKQTPVTVTFNNVRTIDELAGKLSVEVEPDSLQMLNYLSSQEFKDTYQVDDQTSLTLFIPNSYQFYWNSTPEQIVERLVEEQKKFWNDKQRTAKLESLGMSANEVYALASIVEKETQLNSEKPTIAGVYLNRLRKGMLLQADPTVVFANGDFSLRRVLNKHLEVDSPYNTYLYAGLPPGPIYMPSIASIDAVLNNQDHEYLFFCAKPGYNQGHAFAETLGAHNKNAARFHKWLNQERIKG